MDFWGTIIITTGLFLAGLLIGGKVAAAMSKKKLTEVLGIDDEDSDSSFIVAGLAFAVFMILTGVFVKGTDEVQEKPAIQHKQK